MQYIFYFDQTRCTECGTCTVACKDWNGVKPGTVKWRRVYDYEGKETGLFPNIKSRPLVYSCQHCDEPACVSACATQAITKRSDGIVIVDRSKCVNLRSCVSACPFGAIQIAGDEQELPSQQGWATAHPAQKCTFCLDRWNANQKPACVMSCPQRALDAGSKDEILQRYPEAVCAAEVDGIPEDLYNGRHTGPNLYIKRRS